MTTLTIIALFINTLALLVVIYQTRLTKSSLLATKESVDDAKRKRQLEILPKFNWVIQVKVDLEGWRENLQKAQRQLQNAVKEKDQNIFKVLAASKLKGPKDLGLNRFAYDNMPSWLREIWMAGAQYYYDAMSSLPYVWRKDEPDYNFANSWIEKKGTALQSISTLLGLLEDMIPTVMLNAPASLSDEDFLK